MPTPRSLSDQLQRDSATLASQTGSDSARLDVELLLTQALNRPRSFLYSHPEYQLSADEQGRYQALLDQRMQGLPIAYLLARRDFWSLSLAVDERVLIPRPATESIVEHVLQLALPARARAIDLGTGSGAIALALAAERPHWQLLASDRWASALAVASHNRHATNANGVHLVQADWLSAFAAESFDLVVANPPYIASDDPHLTQGDVRFEPISALVSAEQGYADIQTIAMQARACLKPGAYLVMEHGFEQADEVLTRLTQLGYRSPTSFRDDQGLDRFVVAQQPSVST